MHVGYDYLWLQMPSLVQALISVYKKKLRYYKSLGNDRKLIYFSSVWRKEFDDVGSFHLSLEPTKEDLRL